MNQQPNDMRILGWAKAQRPTDSPGNPMSGYARQAHGAHRLPPWKRWLSLRAYGLITSTLFGAGSAPSAMRARFERFSRNPRERMQHKYSNLTFGDYSAGGVSIESVCAVKSPTCAIFYLHGGGYFMGSPASYRNRAMRLSYRCNAEVFVPAYRLAPEHPYPAALNDALSAWLWLCDSRKDASIFVAGDSAGGGLALSLLVKLRDLRFSMPSGALLLSPWTDLTVSGGSIEGNRRKDLWFTRRHLENWASYYVGQANTRSPFLSPVFADLSGLPPLLLFVGENELLLDDTLRVEAAARSVGTQVEVHIGKGMQHDWPLTLPWLDESRRAWEFMRGFTERSNFARDIDSRSERLLFTGPDVSARSKRDEPGLVVP